jgi:hypothetical protein
MNNFQLRNFAFVVFGVLIIILPSYGQTATDKKRQDCGNVKKIIKECWHHNLKDSIYKVDGVLWQNIVDHNADCFKGLSKKKVIKWFGQPSYTKDNDFFYCETPRCRKEKVGEQFWLVFVFDKHNKLSRIAWSGRMIDN